MIAKALTFAALVPKSPVEALDRLVTAVEGRFEAYWSTPFEYEPRTFTAALDAVGKTLGIDLFEFADERGLSEIERAVQTNWNGMSANAPFQTSHNGDICLARLCYCLVRALRANTILETGVCYGLTSSFILQALSSNGCGCLHSIDLPPLHGDGERFVGRLIPDGLRHRWSLHRGAARRLLPPLLKRVGPLDIFIHDSLHTYRNMKMEFDLAWHALRPGGVLVADDVQSNCAFQEFSESAHSARSIVFAEEGKNAVCGLMVKPL